MNDKSYEKEELLINVKDEMEANIIIGLLEMSNISCNKVGKGLGEVYFGSGNLGVDIYVAKSNLEEAKSIIESSPEITENEEFEQDDTVQQNKYKFRRTSLSWIMILLLLSPLLIAIVLWFVGLLS